MKVGTCKECFSEVPMDDSTKVGNGIWECKSCDYPNNEFDFWEIYIK